MVAGQANSRFHLLLRAYGSYGVRGSWGLLQWLPRFREGRPLGSRKARGRGSLGSHTLRERHALASHGARERGGLTSHSSRGRGCRGLNVTGTNYIRFLILFTAKNNSMLNHVASAGTPIANLWFRTPTPHPLDHRANRTICTTGSARTHGPHRRNCKTITCERQMECN